MRYAANFHPAWGYVALALSPLRTARVFVVAAAVGATTGAGVAISLVDRPAFGEPPVAARPSSKKEPRAALGCVELLSHWTAY